MGRHGFQTEGGFVVTGGTGDPPSYCLGCDRATRDCTCIPKTPRPESAKAVFYIDGLIPPVVGHAEPRTWNGWACPYFDKDAAERIVAAWTEEYGTFSGVPGAPVVDAMGTWTPVVDDLGLAPHDCAWFEDDAFFFYCPDSDTLDRFPKSIVNGREVWAIGAGGWTWSTIEPEARYVLHDVDGGVSEVSIVEFFEANTDLGADAFKVVSLCPGDTYTGGGGAQPEWTIGRVDDAKTARR